MEGRNYRLNLKSFFSMYVSTSLTHILALGFFENQQAQYFSYIET